MLLFLVFSEFLVIYYLSVKYIHNKEENDMIDVKNLGKWDPYKSYLGGIKQPDGSYLNIIIDGDKIERVPYSKNLYRSFAASKKDDFIDQNYDNIMRSLYVDKYSNLRCKRGFDSSIHTDINWIRKFIMSHEEIKTVDDYKYKFKSCELGIHDYYYCVNRVVERYGEPEVVPRIHSDGITYQIFVKFFIKKDIDLDRDALIEYVKEHSSDFASKAYSVIKDGTNSNPSWYYSRIPENRIYLRDDNIIEVTFCKN